MPDSPSPSPSPTPNPALLRECRASWDAWARLAAAPAGPGLMFAWAFAEAIAWPIIPDFLLVPLAAASRRVYLPLAAAVLGSALGGTLLYTFALLAPAQAQAFLQHLPAVSPRQIQTADTALAAGGAAAFLGQPWSGGPFKVWAVQAAAVYGLAPLPTIPLFILARAARMAVFAVLARVLAARVRGFLRDFSLFLALVYLVLFFYGWWQVTL